MEVHDVPVATCATAWMHPHSGEVFIFVFNEALYFGDQLDHSLINPNQIRHFGIDVEDNPFRPRIGIDVREGLFIPFDKTGTTISFESRLPTAEELDQCTHIVLTSDAEWDPQSVELGVQTPIVPPHVQDVRFVNHVEACREAGTNRDCLRYESDFVAASLGDGHTEQELCETMVNNVNVWEISQASAVHPRQASELRSNERHSAITPERVSKLFGVGHSKAKRMLKVTTQQGVRMAVHPLTRRYRTDHIHLNRRQLDGKWYLDHMQARRKSIRQCTGAFVFSNGPFTEAYPTVKKNQYDAAASLRTFCDDVGVPHKLKTDFAGQFVGRDTEFMKLVRKNHIDISFAEPGRKNQIWQVDIAIREVNKRWRDKAAEKDIPKRVWCFGIQHYAKMSQFIPRGHDQRTGYELVTGKTPDISEYCDFDFYDLVWYWAGQVTGTNTGRKLARWLGVSHKVGSDMCYWIMPVSGTPIADTTVQHVTADDLISADAKRQVEEFDQHLRERLDDDKFFLESSEGDYHLDDVYDDSAVYGDPEVDNPFTTPSQAEYDVPEERADMDDVSPEQYDQLIGAEFLIDPATAEGQGHCATRTARVIARATDHLGNPLGRPHANPMMDMREYDVEYEDGTTDRYLANQIAENLWSQCDPEGRKHQVFTEIVDHRKDNSAVSIADGFEQGAHGHRKPKKTTRGWDLLVEFVDGSTDWVPLKEVKAGNPVELAEYAVSNKIQEEPAFKWWVPYVIQKRNRIISKVKAKYWRTTHKFGVRLPKSVKEALELDRINKNHLWEDSMKKEMGKACVAYEEVEGCTPDDVRDNKVPQLRSFQEIKCHIIFDVKMDFTRKARFVAGGHMTEAPSSLTYSSVVSRDSVKIAFLLAALNDLDIMACDIGNAYLNAPCREKIWFEAGPECGALRGKVCKLVRALYGLKSSGAAWRKMFSDFIVNELNFTPSKADPDVYMRRATRGPTEAELDTDAHIAGADGTRMSKTSTKATVGVPQGDYYEYLLVYVDDVLLVSHDPQRTMKDIGKRFEIKNDAYGHPEIYLGAGIAKMTTVDDNREVWTMESKKYVEAAVQTVKDLLAEDGRELKPGKNSAGPLPTNYQPELDVTHECDEEMSSRFRQLIGILRWACELGRLDIQLEVSLMSQYQASPREGHLEALYLIFAYLSRHPMKRVVFDPKLPDVDESSFSQADWTDFYGDVEEEDPPHMPEPLGNHVMMSCFVDANHAGNKVTRRSHTGVVILLNDAPIQVFCKRQNTVESSTFGSELVAMRIARDLVSALRIKLKWFGVPLLGPTNMFCDNEAVCKNTSSPESTLTKKHNAINFHICREAVAAGIMRVAKEDTKTNLADAFTKLLPYSRKMELLGRLLHNH